MLSYWEKESFIAYDFIIVGGGIVGFSTALSLKEKYPKASVLVLEAGLLPSGASTKNAGFACVGSLSEIVEDLKHHTEDEVVQLVRLRNEGLQLLRKRLGENRIQYEATGSNELVFPHEEHLLNELPKINQILGPTLGENVFKENPKGIQKHQLSASISTLIHNRAEGSIHTGEMMKQLIFKAQMRGVAYKTNSKVSRVIEEASQVVVKIENEDIQLKARKVCICTNAFTKTLVPDLDLKPGRGQVLITHPIKDLQLRGIFHFDQGYYYFREINGRVLLGGGRNIDFDTEQTTIQELNTKIQADLESKLEKIIIPDHTFEIAMRWTGIMAFGKQKKPIIKDISDNVIAGVRLGGMGVAIGSKLGDLLADKLEL